MDLEGKKYVVYDAYEGTWFMSMENPDFPEETVAPGGCGVWTGLRKDARKMTKKEARALCKELKKRANDDSWPIGVQLAPFFPAAMDELKQLWEEFGDVPVNDDDEIQCKFLGFGAGTDRFEVWNWFDQQCPNGLFEDILGVKPAD